MRLVVGGEFVFQYDGFDDLGVGWDFSMLVFWFYLYGFWRRWGRGLG